VIAHDVHGSWRDQGHEPTATEGEEPFVMVRRRTFSFAIHIWDASRHAPMSADRQRGVGAEFLVQPALTQATSSDAAAVRIPGWTGDGCAVPIG
jgi:hypothetical protein